MVLTEYQYSSYTYDAGIYILASTYPDLKQQLVYGEPETVHQIPPKYIKDMYYEEEEGDVKIEWDGSTSGRESGSFYYSAMMSALTAYKVSDEILTEDIIKSISTNSYENTNPLIYQEANYLVVECLNNDYAFIVNQDYTGGGDQANVSKGVYFTANIIELVYTSTVVNKIPSKYLPDMPSGGIETVELLSIPTNYASIVAGSTFFSADDLAKVKSSDVCIAAYSASPARKFLVVNDAGTLTFYGKDGVEFMLEPYYVAGYFTATPINGGSIILSGLPSASMTQAVLEALGFGQYGINFNAWRDMRAKNVAIVSQYGSTEQVLGVIALTDNYLEFWDATNKYVVTNQLMQLACTVTPRT